MSEQKIENLVNALREVLTVPETQEEKSVEFSVASYIKFTNESGKGLLWTGKKDYTKQFVFNRDPDKFFSSESIDLSKDKSLMINGVKVIDSTSLGTGIVKSNLTSVGRLKGLIVDGGFVLNDFVHFDPTSDRLGLGTDEPNAALDITDQGTNIVIGAREYNNAQIGTYNSTNLELITDNTTRITVSAGGNIELGNKNFGPVEVKVLGTLGVDVVNVDPRTKLHVNGAIKFNNCLHLSGTAPPSGGAFSQGDIVWNSNPQQKHFIGWVCTKSGNPGIWCPFGEIR